MDGQTAGEPGAIWAYGSSYAVVRPGWRRPLHYLPQAARALGVAEVRSFAVNGARIIDAAAAMLLDGTAAGCPPPIPGARWPEDGSRVGTVVVDSLFNDVGHYEDIHVFPVVPVPVVGDDYVAGIATLTRAALALASSGSRQGVAAASLHGGWTPSLALGESDTALVAVAPGDRATFRAQAPQDGPLAGRVWLLARAVDPGVGSMAPVQVEVDGRPVGPPLRPAAWERYVGRAGVAVDGIVTCTPVDLPRDGREHEISLVHAGRPDEQAYVDGLVVAARHPNPVAVMGVETPPRARLWSREQVAVWARNRALVMPSVQAVVAEFPNACYVPSTMPARGISGRDGIHPNPWGNRRRARDLRRALSLS